MIIDSQGRLSDNPQAPVCLAQWGEAVHAIVILKPGHVAAAAEIIAHCRERIANYKCPRSVEFRSEPLPLSGAGKVLNRELRAPYWEG